MPHIKSIITLTVLSLSSIHADTIGGEASLGIFNHSPEGYASYTLPFGQQGTSADIVDTLGFSETQDIFLKLYIEHPLPILPNVKLAYTALSHEGNSQVTLFSWGDIVNFTGKVDSSLSLDMTDTTLYYEISDNWVNLDVGLTLRYLTGNMDVNHETLSFSTFVPLLYAKTRFDFPMTDLSLQLEANAVSYAGITSYDYELSARYTLAMGIGLEAGYKAFHLDSNDLLDGFDANMDFSGPYAAAVWDF